MKKRSNSSSSFRLHLQTHYATVPPLVKTVSLSRYVALCKTSYENAMEKYNKYSANKNVTACNAAYVDFYKFLILALERVPSHADYHNMDLATEKWLRYALCIVNL